MTDLKKAIFVYPASHYSHWQKTLQKPDFTIGAFGENIAVLHLMEEDVYIGDVFQVGEVMV